MKEITKKIIHKICTEFGVIEDIEKIINQPKEHEFEINRIRDIITNGLLLNYENNTNNYLAECEIALDDLNAL